MVIFKAAGVTVEIRQEGSEAWVEKAKLNVDNFDKIYDKIVEHFEAVSAACVHTISKYVIFSEPEEATWIEEQQ